MSVEARLAELGITLPEAAAPVAAYVAAVEANGLLHISGQISLSEGQLMTGRLGEDRDLDYGVKAARACGLNLIPQIKAALGSLDRVERIVKLGAFISSAPSFTEYCLFGPVRSSPSQSVICAVCAPFGTFCSNA